MRLMVLLLAAGVVFAQRPTYEAAEIKVNTSGSEGDSSKGTLGQLLMHNMTLKSLIERAYTVNPYQVLGADWLGNVRFDIAAKYPADTQPGDRDLMLRTLLEDRLMLGAHRETREMPGYVLGVVKSGFKLKPVGPGPGDWSSHGGAVRTLTATKLSMKDFTKFLTRNLGQTVADKTGVDGVYDFEIKWSRDDLDIAVAAPATGEHVHPSEAPSLFKVLQDQLGLKLQPQKVPVEVIVVDHAERSPVEK
jgi:uncharacterized protein (TIGR03435 family)